MATDMYGNPTGQAQAFQPGSKQYQDTALELQQGATDPMRRKALARMESDFASRGLGSSGLYGEAAGGVEQDYLKGMQEFSGRTAMRGADVGEEGRRRVESRGWQVEDRDKAWDRALWMMEHQESRADQAAQQGASDQFWQSAAGMIPVVGDTFGSFITSQRPNRVGSTQQGGYGQQQGGGSQVNQAQLYNLMQGAGSYF